MKDTSQSRDARTVTGRRAHGATVTRYANERKPLAGGADASRRAVTGLTGWVRRVWGGIADAINPAGWLLLATVVGGAVAALAWGWVEAWVLAIGAFLLLVLCVPFLIGGHSYRVNLVFEKDRVVAGHDITAELALTNVGRRVALPALLDIPVGQGLIEAHIPLLRKDAQHVETLTISAPRRGVISVGPMTIGRGDPLGMLRRDHTWPDVQNLYVHPVTVTIPPTSAGLLRDVEGAITKTIVDSDLNFHAIRDYAAGDSRRQVHWRSTAKTGRLMVRQYEETRRSRIAIVLDLERGMYESDDEFEMAVSVAASLGLQAIRDKRELVATASADIPQHLRGSMHSIRTLPTLTGIAMLDAMSAVEASADVMSLAAVSRMTSQDTPQLSLVFLVTGAQTTIPQLRKAAVSFASDVTVMAVRCEPGAAPSLRTSRELRVMTLGMLHDLGHMMLKGAL